MKKQLSSKYFTTVDKYCFFFYRAPNTAIKYLLTNIVIFILRTLRNVQKVTKFFWGTMKHLPESTQ